MPLPLIFAYRCAAASRADAMPCEAASPACAHAAYYAPRDICRYARRAFMQRAVYVLRGHDADMLIMLFVYAASPCRHALPLRLRCLHLIRRLPCDAYAPCRPLRCVSRLFSPLAYAFDLRMIIMLRARLCRRRRCCDHAVYIISRHACRLRQHAALMMFVAAATPCCALRSAAPARVRLMP